jgi:predicted MPP superfamily phosphohydrolase
MNSTQPLPSTSPARRIFAISDLHVDYKENLNLMMSLSAAEYGNDVLIVAGDVSDNPATLEKCLSSLVEAFHKVFFVPGNHELWVSRSKKTEAELKGFNSVIKFDFIMALCGQLGISTEPQRITSRNGTVYIVPLFSWYIGPEDPSEGTLYVEKNPERDRTHDMWNDFFLCHWPEAVQQQGIAHYFLSLNEKALQLNYDAPVISFSHFLPRRNLIFKYLDWRQRLGKLVDPLPEFNFTRVAGCEQLDQQLRTIGAKLHVYGHQHRDRHREEDGVVYVSHCLGYPRERLHRSEKDNLPKVIWSDGRFREQD